MELGLVAASFAQGDIFEGIRALVIDKDNRPRWTPATLGDVREADIEAYFAPLGPDEDFGGRRR
jgi:hypothetical protein